MRIFNTVQNSYAILGISSPNQSKKNLLLVLFIFLLYACNFVSLYVYIFYVANDFMEYIEIANWSSGSVIIFVCFVAIVFRKDKLFKAIDDMEILFEKSEPNRLSFRTSFWKLINYCLLGSEYPESRRFFLKTVQQVERVCEIVFMVLLKIQLQLFMLPKCIASYCAYFFTDSGADSFQLPCPMW